MEKINIKDKVDTTEVRVAEAKITKTTEKASKNILKTQIVEIALISKSPNAIMSNGDDVVLLRGCSIEIIPDLDSNDNIKEVLTKDEASFLEEYLGLPENALNVYKKENNFWVNNRNSKIVLTRTGNSLESATVRLDLSNPYDYIKYKVALSSRLVSPSWEQRYDNPDWKFSIRRSDDEKEELDKKVTKESKVIKYLIEHETSQVKLFNLLRLFHTRTNKAVKNFSHSQDAKWLFNQLWTYTKIPKDIDVLYSILDMKDEERLEEVFLINGLGSGAILLQGNIYKLSGGGILGYSKQEAIDFFKMKDNQTSKLIVQKTIDDYFKVK